MPDITFIEPTNHVEIAQALKKLCPNGAHFTNGTYAFNARLIIPTTLAGFKHVIDQQPELPIVVAVNSDASMLALNKTDLEPQQTRASKIAGPLATLFPKNPVTIIYYDEPTPTQLYETLQKHHVTKTLHKWGYGTTPDAPKIEGAECFQIVYGFPLPNDIKPVCYLDTAVQQQPQHIIVADLRGTLINKDGLLFDVPTELQEYHAPDVAEAPALPKGPGI